MPNPEVPDLVGKIIAVMYDSGDLNHAYIEVLRFELQAGRHFIVGKTIKTSSDDSEGIRFCVAWDVVTSYYEFDSVEECNKAIAKWYPPKKSSRFWFS